jgi:hypothetical protein
MKEKETERTERKIEKHIFILREKITDLKKEKERQIESEIERDKMQ